MSPCPFTIFTGNNKTMNLKAIYAMTEDPVDLTDCTEIDISLPKADGTFAHFLYSGAQVIIASPPVLGKFSAVITSLVSIALNPGELQNFDVTFTIGTEIFTVSYVNSLSVFQNT